MSDGDNLLLPSGPAYCRFQAADGLPHLGWWDGSKIADLTLSGAPGVSSLGALLALNESLGPVAHEVAADAPHRALADVTLLAPIDDQEVWAAGVTYERSRAAREHESEHAKDVYARVYSAERPELFFKADARRTVGPNGRIRVRSDSRWTVPEPELALVLNASLQIVGYTIGNDVSSRDIEGENPLYLPQAKLYTGCCALGPWIVPAELVTDPYALDIACSIVRQGTTVWTDHTSTGLLHRRLDELVSYLGRCNSFPSGAFLLTGTCLVPPDSLTLQPGDEVEIAISGLGMLRNTVAIA